MKLNTRKAYYSPLVHHVVFDFLFPLVLLAFVALQTLVVVSHLH